MVDVIRQRDRLLVRCPQFHDRTDLLRAYLSREADEGRFCRVCPDESKQRRIVSVESVQAVGSHAANFTRCKISTSVLVYRFESFPQNCFMTSGYYLKSGMHWGHYTPGFGGGWLTCADQHRATRFDNQADAVEALRASGATDSFEVVQL